MHQTIHGNLLPSCNSYESAVKVWENAHQAKKFENGWRGLKDRRDSSKIVRMIDDAVYFRFHHTDLVEWKPKKLLVRTWDSLSSAVFSNRFLPNNMYAASRGGEMYIEHKGMSYQAGSGPLVFTRHDDEWVVDESTVLRWTKEVLDKSKAARVRKILKPFLDWKATLDRLQNGQFADPSQIQAIAMGLLKEAFAEGEIPVNEYPHLRDNVFVHGKDFMHQCYILGGAVTKADALLGEVRVRTPYAGLSAWTWV